MPQESSPNPSRWLLLSITDGAIVLLEDERAGDATPGRVELRVDGALTALREPGGGSFVDPLLGVNQLWDGGLLTGMDQWRISPAKRIANLATGFQRAKGAQQKTSRTGFLRTRRPDTPVVMTYHDPVAGEHLPVQGGRSFQAFGDFVSLRCQAELALEFFDRERRFLCEVRQTVVESRKEHKRARTKRVTLTGIIPATASFIRLLARKFPTAAGDDSLLFFTRFWFGYGEHDPERDWEPARIDSPVLARLRRSGQAMRRSSIALPGGCFDGEPHVIEVVERSTGNPVVGSPRTFRERPPARGGLHEVSGASVLGWIEPCGQADEIPLLLLIDDEPAGEGNVQLEVAVPACFRLPIPTGWLDGLPHRLTVRMAGSGGVLGELAAVVPAITSSWTSLQGHGGDRLPARLAPAAGLRYESMIQWLASGNDPDSPGAADRFAQLGRAHEVLVRGFESIRDFAPIVFPPVEHPDVSVIVPMHNHAAMTYACLAGLRFAFNRTTFEVIVVDDGSTDPLPDLPALIDGVTFLRQEQNQGFVRACNLGAEHARGNFLVMLNNDTEPAVRWLDELRFIFDTFEDVGLAGSKLLFPDGRLQDAGGIVWSNGNPWNYGRTENPEDPRFNYTRQVDYLTGAAIMIPRQTWAAVGGFSEVYRPAYFEDTDLAFKIRAIGQRVVYAPKSIVYHREGLSSASTVAGGVKAHQEINRPVFKRRWLYAFQGNGAEGEAVDLVKDRNIRLRALVIDVAMPRPDRDAGGHAAVQEMRLLQSLGCKVTFLPLNLARLGSYTDELERLGVEFLHAPFVLSAADLLARRGDEFDLVYITRYTAARHVLKDIRRYAPRAKILFCNADLHFLRALRLAIAGNDPAGLAAAKVIRTEELKVMRQVDVVLSYNTVEHTVIQSHNLDKTLVVTAPWVVDVLEEIPPFDARADVAFLGGFAHTPNLLAVRFFIHEVMPLLRERLPGVRFRVFGSGVPDELRLLQSDDVLIEGWVADVREVYNRCRVFVAPLTAGAGLKGKVVEAMAHGAPSVLSPIAAEGISVRSGWEAFIAEAPADWVSAIAKLYEDPEQWGAMSDRARVFARANYSFARGRALMAAALNAAGITTSLALPALVARAARAEH